MKNLPETYTEGDVREGLIPFLRLYLPDLSCCPQTLPSHSRAAENELQRESGDSGNRSKEAENSLLQKLSTALSRCQSKLVALHMKAVEEGRYRVGFAPTHAPSYWQGPYGLLLPFYILTENTL
jgi:hypothetical protein